MDVYGLGCGERWTFADAILMRPRRCYQGAGMTGTEEKGWGSAVRKRPTLTSGSIRLDA